MENLDSIFVCRINEKQEEAFHELFRRFFNYLVVTDRLDVFLGGNKNGPNIDNEELNNEDLEEDTNDIEN